METTQTTIAPLAEQASNLAGSVIVVHVERSPGYFPSRGGATADRAPAALSIQHGVVISFRHAVSGLQSMLSLAYGAVALVALAAIFAVESTAAHFLHASRISAGVCIHPLSVFFSESRVCCHASLVAFALLLADAWGASSAFVLLAGPTFYRWESVQRKILLAVTTILSCDRIGHGRSFLIKAWLWMADALERAAVLSFYRGAPPSQLLEAA